MVIFSLSHLFQQHFITTEVLKLFSLKKEPNHKTDWQKMMKFGRKKRDRVDHILVSAHNQSFYFGHVILTQNIGRVQNESVCS